MEDLIVQGDAGSFTAFAVLAIIMIGVYLWFKKDKYK